MLLKKLFLLFIFAMGSTAIFSQCSYITSFKTDMYGGPSKSVKAGNKLFFTVSDSLHGRELWITDGTTLGTYMVKDINPGITNGLADYFELTSFMMNGILYFRADDGSTGIELWRSDGTNAGTYLLKDMSIASPGSAPGGFASAGNILYFTVNTGTSLWRSDGTPSGTYVLKSFTVVSNLAGFNGNLFFSADNSNGGQELWKSNGTTSGTQLLKDLNGVPGASLPCNFHASTNALYFMANTNSGWELWKTTGSAASTVMVKDINPSGDGVLSFYSDSKIINLGDTVYFRAQDGVNGFQLWRSDGSDSGTVMVSNLTNGISAYSTFPVLNGKVMLENYAVQNWWQYDPVSDSLVETNFPFYYFFETYTNAYSFTGNNFCFAGKDTIYGSEMWRSDGTLTNTKIIQETHLTDNWFSSSIQGFNRILGNTGNNLLFTLARNPTNTLMPLYSYTVTDTNTCYPPSVIVPVPVSPTGVYFTWNRIEGTFQYEFRYRISGSTIWTTSASQQSYIELKNLTANSNYEYQVRSDCGLTWSPLKLYNTAFIQNDYILHILAERAEDNTTERIFWLQTPYITKMQIRYRVYGSTGWNYSTNGTGCNRLTGLLPGTFYEYEYKPYLGGAWGTWYLSYRYFVTDNLINTEITELNNTDPDFIAFPNPCFGIMTVKGIVDPGTTYAIYDVQGRCLVKEKPLLTTIDLTDFNEGIYLIRICNGKRNSYHRILNAY